MKKLFYYPLLAVAAMSFISCKKDLATFTPLNLTSRQTDKNIKKEKCKADKKKPCVPNPYAVGMMVVPQGLQVGTYVLDITMYYINPNDPSIDTCSMKFTIGGQTFLNQSRLIMADINNLGTLTGTIAVTQNSFNAVTLGYHLHQMCYCDSSYYYSSYSGSNTSVAVMNKFPTSTIEKRDGKIYFYFAENNSLLKRILEAKISGMRFKRQKM